MLIGVSSGLRILSTLLNLYQTYAEGYVYAYAGNTIGGITSVVVNIIFFIISAGGYSVLVGCGLILVHLHRIGRKIISLGAGIGAVGMFIYILYLASIEPSLGQGSGLLPLIIFILITMLDAFFIGAILTIVGKKKMKAFEKMKKEQKKEEKELLNDTDIIPAYERGIHCPSCGALNEDSNRFCRNFSSILSPSPTPSDGQSFLSY